MDNVEKRRLCINLERYLKDAPNGLKFHIQMVQVQLLEELPKEECNVTKRMLREVRDYG